jgi:ElaB/YqjD/DUF883 family membrane-anchored ribosome-binding protein
VDYTQQGETMNDAIGGNDRGESSSSGTAGATENFQETMGDKAQRVKDRVADTGRRTVDKIDASREPTADALGRAASGIHETTDRATQRLSGAAHRAADRIQATADYVREHDLRAIGNDVVGIVNRYPRESVAIAVALGFLLGRAFRSRT